MLEIIFHIIGICPDSFMHLDLIDIISLYGNDLLVLTKNLKLKIIK